MENPDYNKNVAALETLILEQDVKFEELDPYFLNLVDEAVQILAHVGAEATLFEAFKAGEVDLRYSSTHVALLAATLAKVHQFWYNADAARIDEANLLNGPTIHGDWRDGFHHAMAVFLAENGSVMRWSDGYYGWQEYDYPKKSVRAVFNVKEDFWEEFDHTFADESLHRHGVTGEVLFEDGTQRYMRWEGDIREVMSNVISNRQAN